MNVLGLNEQVNELAKSCSVILVCFQILVTPLVFVEEGTTERV